MSDENERLYRDLKSKYQCLLRKNKEKAKIKYMTEDMNNDPYKSLKKLAYDQGSNQFPDELVINNNSITNKEIIMKELISSFFPDPKPINKKKTRIYRRVLNVFVAKSGGRTTTNNKT